MWHHSLVPADDVKFRGAASFTPMLSKLFSVGGVLGFLAFT